jgi:cytochrome c oxidase subunit 4
MHVATDLSLYRNIFLCLVALTGVTVSIAFVDLGPWNVLVALAVASTKALLVLLYFMGLRWADRLIRFGVVSAVFAVLILLGGVLNDDFHRQIKRFQPVQEIRASLEDLRVRGLDGLPAREGD